MAAPTSANTPKITNYGCRTTTVTVTELFKSGLPDGYIEIPLLEGEQMAVSRPDLTWCTGSRLGRSVRR